MALSVPVAPPFVQAGLDAHRITVQPKQVHVVVLEVQDERDDDSITPPVFRKLRWWPTYVLDDDDADVNQGEVECKCGREMVMVGSVNGAIMEDEDEGGG